MHLHYATHSQLELQFDKALLKYLVKYWFKIMNFLNRKSSSFPPVLAETPDHQFPPLVQTVSLTISSLAIFPAVLVCLYGYPLSVNLSQCF